MGSVDLNYASACFGLNSFEKSLLKHLGYRSISLQLGVTYRSKTCSNKTRPKHISFLATSFNASQGSNHIKLSFHTAAHHTDALHAIKSAYTHTSPIVTHSTSFIPSLVNGFRRPRVREMMIVPQGLRSVNPVQARMFNNQLTLCNHGLTIPLPTSLPGIGILSYGANA
ncbi:hypothetical protein SAICODRAFT_28805 [Saitoella complicata NRRL Y-17804]|uniref:uncharacterized protein n=1 Tax=Saitoella complicata (strain BCRC 22490 / CBS 7301 / JCM 7358 / NBRC 10748 / NRRL Y-17804) TaxID=698492 RepID=UPI000866E609|nr:uncharacterized protein SAICODRAFT_28805 [Saitoella complicata NRRL Y-17804]ODQ55767.1 hypothetical protein SAICODRAFT_28805 [Saitoella complicata NRRL Y-17804]